MDTLQKIYDTWSEEQKRNQEIADVWGKILKCMSKNCSEQAREEIATHMMEYGRLVEKNAFIAGYGQAFRLWIDIMSTIEI